MPFILPDSSTLGLSPPAALLCVPLQVCFTSQSSQPPIVFQKSINGHRFHVFYYGALLHTSSGRNEVSKQKLEGEWQANSGGDVHWFPHFRFQWNGAALDTNEMIWDLWSYRAVFGKIKRVIIHQMMNCVCQRGNNCFIALLKTMGECDLWGGRQTCSRTKRWWWRSFLCGNWNNFQKSGSVY